jgi:hypothetical protein
MLVMVVPFRIEGIRSSVGGGCCAHAVAGRNVTDRCGEEVRVLAGGQVTTGKGENFGLRAAASSVSTRPDSGS